MDLVSGPDVGGGFLFQLTVEPAEPLARFTVHAQEGSIDGGEPTAGSPESIGFERVSRPCSIGGRQCWHREYELPADRQLLARFAYNRLRFVIGPMIRQHQPGTAVPFVAGLRETLKRITGPLRDRGTPWMVGGSAAPYLLGAEVGPRDLDLSTTREGVGILAEALGDMLVDPEARLRRGTGPPRWWARAFVGTFKDGLTVEWGEAATAGENPGPGSFEWSTEGLSGAIAARFEEWEVPVAPPEASLVKAALADRADRVHAIAALVRRRGPSWELLDRLFDESGAPEVLRTSVRARLGR